MPVENRAGQEQIQVHLVYEGSVAWISVDGTQDRECGYTGLTSGLNHWQTNPLPRQLNSLWLDLFASNQWKVTSLWDFSPQRLMEMIPPVHDLGRAGMMTSDRQTGMMTSDRQTASLHFYLEYTGLFFMFSPYCWLVPDRIKKIGQFSLLTMSFLLYLFVNTEFISEWRKCSKATFVSSLSSRPLCYLLVASQCCLWSNPI